MKSRGFTLIELLVVISIIGMLSSIVLSSLNSARVKADNAFRSSVVKEYVNAAQLYYDTYGEFPNTGVEWTFFCLGDYEGDGHCGWTEDTDVSVALNNKFTQFIKTLQAFKPITDNASALAISLYGSTGSIVGGKIEFEGPIYRCRAMTNGKCIDATIAWELTGLNQLCTLSNSSPTETGSGLWGVNTTSCQVYLK